MKLKSNIEMSVDLLKKLHDDLIKFAAKLNFDKSHPWHRNLIALHGSLIELSGALLILLTKGGKIGVPSIVRTIIETYVEFHNLLKDKTYGYHMEAQYNDRWIKLLKESAKGTNPYLRSFNEMPDLSETITNMEKELADFKFKGYKPLLVSERFDRADMMNEYYSIYHLLSADTHANIISLVSRHIKIKGSDFDIIYYKDLPIEEFLWYINLTCVLLVRSAIGIHELLNSEVLSEVKALENDIEAWERELSTTMNLNL